jgi:hypothetical protein
MSLSENSPVRPRPAILSMNALCILSLVFIGIAQSAQDCFGDIISINERVFVRMTGRPQLLDEIEIVKFERQFRESFNVMSFSNCFGGSYIVVNSVEVQKDFLTSMEIGKGGDDSTESFTLRLRVRGTCLGCDKDTLFTRSLRRLEFSADGNLLSSLESDLIDDTTARKAGKGKTPAPTPAPTTLPPCPRCTPPSEGLFITSLNAGVQFLRQRGQIVNIDAIQSVTELDQIFCDSEIVEFKTDVFIDFVGDVDLVDDIQLAKLKLAFQETFNKLNLLSEDTCDVFYRQIVDVDVVLNAGLNRRRRHLQAASAGSFSVRFILKCVCRGCEPNSPLFSALSSPSRTSPNRVLQSVNSDLCFCARDAQFRSPTLAEFQAALQETLNKERFANMSSIGTVGRVLEVEPVPCSGQVEFFEDIVAVRFLGDPGTLTPEDIARLESLFIQSYTQAQESFCDPYFRTISNVTLISQIDEQRRHLVAIKLRSFSFVFRIVGFCRGCPKRGLFQNDAPKRHLMFDESSSRVDLDYNIYRRMETLSTCYCSVNALYRSPNEADFQFVYSRNVNGRVDGIGNITNVDGFVTSAPSSSPSKSPSVSPSVRPSLHPSSKPSLSPSKAPSRSPSFRPSLNPSRVPTKMPSSVPSLAPSLDPSVGPSNDPTLLPSSGPSECSDGGGCAPEPTPQPTGPPKRPPVTPKPTIGLKRPPTNR